MRKDPRPASKRKALITGATSGLGEALAHFLSGKGYTPLLTGRTIDKLKNRGLALDLTLPEERKRLIQLIERETPELIINNAGFGLYGESCSLSIEQQLAMIELNVKAAVEISLASARALVAAGKKGTLLNIASAAAFFPFPQFNVYAASKAFLLHFSIALDSELRDKGIRVLCACPGPIDTPFRTRAAQGASTRQAAYPVEKAVAALWKQIETGRGVSIFDQKTRLLVLFARLLPRRLQQRLLSRSIDSIKN